MDRIHLLPKMTYSMWQVSLVVKYRFLLLKVSKGAKIRNRYNQVPRIPIVK